MARVQDIQISDANLKAQYIANFINGNYQAMADIISNNPQLDTKAFVADVINIISGQLTDLQENYSTNVPDYLAALATELNTRIGQFKDFDAWSSSKEYFLYNFVNYNSKIYMLSLIHI